MIWALGYLLITGVAWVTIMSFMEDDSDDMNGEPPWWPSLHALLLALVWPVLCLIVLGAVLIVVLTALNAHPRNRQWWPFSGRK